MAQRSTPTEVFLLSERAPLDDERHDGDMGKHSIARILFAQSRARRQIFIRLYLDLDLDCADQVHDVRALFDISIVKCIYNIEYIYTYISMYMVIDRAHRVKEVK